MAFVLVKAFCTKALCAFHRDPHGRNVKVKPHPMLCIRVSLVALFQEVIHEHLEQHKSWPIAVIRTPFRQQFLRSLHCIENDDWSLQLFQVEDVRLCRKRGVSI